MDLNYQAPSMPYGIAWIYASILLLFMLMMKLRGKSQPDLGSIPTVGPAGPFGSYIGAIQFLFNGSHMLQEGYEKHKMSAFKVPNLNRWLVIVSGPKLVEELRKAPRDQLSFTEAANELVQVPFTLSPGIATDPYHVPILNFQLTRNLHIIFPEIREEMILAFEDAIPLTGTNWNKVPALDTLMRVINRISNRVFVGLPLCRNPDFMALSLGFALDVLKAAIAISMFPVFLRPVVARFCTNLPSNTKRTMKHLRPMVEERQRNMDLHGKDYPNKPNDLLSWLMTEAVGNYRTLREFSLRILALNFAAIHTTSSTFTHALYHLATNPEYIQPLRDEIEAVVREEGWTKIAMDKMRKVDSFVKESMRFSDIRAVSMLRKAVKPFTFSDGTHLPVGAFVSAASLPTHYDTANYNSAGSFDGFRFANSHQEDGGMKRQIVTTAADFLPWGHGRGSCPGRFFAATEMKMMLAHIVMTYDVKLETEGVRPADFWIEANRLPHQTAEVMFRRRQGQNACR